ncbi:thiolase domain-containing protein [Papillibacter cinnamivorans]|uniref:Acetyl-CoA C-acetyltransferase n=1 Tax=Papillibacter cinnamivorans DSM 12816 TaxID=1122930 RepID=A0A1W2A1D6_9FIRM|nr:thiolase domain-containing protein [Papillibacter cinnamivorans]SMC54426.1 acetyl-CoA C-acetyltransferase [Papillibacter cinnamivorans DSM 12816]
MRGVSVIGIGETKMGKYPGTLKDMIREGAEKAISDAKIDKKLIEAIYFGNFNGSFWSGQSLMGPLVAEAIGLEDLPTMRLEGACATGSLAFRQGFYSIACGLYDVVLVGGAELMTHKSTPVITEGLASATDVELEAKVGATFPSLFALAANRYFYEYGNVREEMAMAAVQNHANACLNPDAQMHKRIDVDTVKNGFPVAYPLTVYDCSLVSDGSAFIVLAASEIADKISGSKIVDVLGSGHGGSTIQVSTKNITSFAATRNAAKEAYGMAGLKPSDIDFAEVHDCFTITQIINIEDLGFFEKGRGARAISEGRTALDGAIPINSSGGLKAKGHPIGATGLSQIFEVVTQLRGDAGERQIKNARIGLNHNLGGMGATCVINIFRGRE